MCGGQGYEFSEDMIKIWIPTEFSTKDSMSILFAREALGNKVVKRSLRSDLFLMNVLGAD
jgi:hypothetical protein